MDTNGYGVCLLCHIMLELCWFTAVLYQHLVCNKGFGPAAACVFITLQLVLKGSWSNLKMFEELVLAWLILMVVPEICISVPAVNVCCK